MLDSNNPPVILEKPLRDEKGRLLKGGPSLNKNGCKGADGKGTGAKVKRRIKDVNALCDEMTTKIGREFCVVKELLQMAVAKETKTKVKIEILKELLPYVAAKNKAVEISFGDEAMDRLLLTLNLDNHSQVAANNIEDEGSTDEG